MEQHIESRFRRRSAHCKRVSGDTFVSSIEQGTITGVLRQHAMRLNSTVSCKKFSRADFPTNCNGSFPFRKWYAHSGNYTRVCVPGHHAISPWTLSRNRQDIAEHLYLDVVEDLDKNRYPAAWGMISNYTLHCTAYSTRGCFELGNYRNNYTRGPLLQKWPAREELARELHDVFDKRVEGHRRGDPIPSAL